ncbi:MAG: CBS domain-containing protein [archaeon GB-1867-005]|nr:CBS domain-containing protein [Candidatus Culexmicrobium cathedralense]
MPYPRVERIRVEDVMTKNPITVSQGTTVDVVAKLMRDHEIGSVIVVASGDNSPIGIVTERDLTIQVIAEGRVPSKVKVSEIMSSPLITISPKTSLTEAARLMARKNIRRLVVIDEGKLVGIITARDILKVAPEIIEILIESARISEPESAYVGEELLAGYCDECGEWSDSLLEVDGRFLCPDCRST